MTLLALALFSFLQHTYALVVGVGVYAAWAFA